MKKTQEDRIFAKRFAQALQFHVSRERDKGGSLAKIAKKLGVTAAGLRKQLAGGTPSIRTVAFAYEHYDVSVPYAGVEVAEVTSTKRKGKRRKTSEQQLLLPLDITAPPSSTGLLLKPIPKSVRRYRLQITVGVAS